MARLTIQIVNAPSQGARVRVTGPAGAVDPRFERFGQRYARWLVDADPGRYRIQVEQAGYLEEERFVELDHRGRDEIFYLAPMPAFGEDEYLRLRRGGAQIPYRGQLGLLGLFPPPDIDDDLAVRDAFVEVAKVLIDALPLDERAGAMDALRAAPPRQGRFTSVPWRPERTDLLSEARRSPAVLAAGPILRLLHPLHRVGQPAGDEHPVLLTQVAHIKMAATATREQLGRHLAELGLEYTSVRPLRFGVGLHAVDFAPDVGEELITAMAKLVDLSHGSVLSADVDLVTEVVADGVAVAALQFNLAGINHQAALEALPSPSPVTVAVLDLPGSFKGLDQIGLDEEGAPPRLISGMPQHDGHVVKVAGGARYKRHGVACASVIAAPRDGQDGFRGVAPTARVMPVRIYGGGEAKANAFLWAAGLLDPSVAAPPPVPADVISCSVGAFPIAEADIIGAALETVATQGRDGLGCVIVCSAGNAGALIAADRPWALSDHVITCGACFDTREVVDGEPMYELADYSNLGFDLCAPSTQTIDNSDAPLLLALGQPAATPSAQLTAIASTPSRIEFGQDAELSVDDVLLARQGARAWAWRVAQVDVGGTGATVKPVADALDQASPVELALDTRLRAFGATSAAAPTVAGIAALLLGADPGLSGAEVRAALEAGASRNLRLPTQERLPADGSRHPLLGVGRVRAAASLTALRSVADRPALRIAGLVVVDADEEIATEIAQGQPGYRAQVEIRNEGGAESAVGAIRIYVTDPASARPHPGRWAALSRGRDDGSAWSAGVYLVGEVTFAALPAGGAVTLSIPWASELIPSWDRCVVLAELSPQTGPTAGLASLEDNHNLFAHTVDIRDGVRLTSQREPETLRSLEEATVPTFSPHRRVVIRLTEFRLLRSHDFDGRDDIVLSCTVKAPGHARSIRFPDASAEILAAGEAWRPTDALLLDAQLTTGSAVTLEFSCVDRDWVFHDDLGCVTGRLVSGFAGWAGEHVPARTPDVQWTVRYAVEVTPEG